MEREFLYKDVIAGIASAKWELQERAKRVDKQNRTILHIASMDGSLELVQYIFREFANNNFLVKVDSNQETALHVAAFHGHTEVVEVLIDAARSLPSSANDDPRYTISCFEDFVRQTNNGMNTALHLAVRNHNVDIVALLVKADPNDKHIRNSDGYTPICLAAEQGYNDIVKLICKACTAPTMDGPKGQTALHYAIMKLAQAKKEDIDVVEKLIDAAERSLSSTSRFKAFIRQADHDKMDTAVHLAVRRKHLDVVQLILNKDSTYPLENTSSDLKTPIYIAAEQGDTNMVKLLCESSQSGYMTRGPGDKTALHAAVIGRNRDCVRFLLDNKAACLVTYADENGWTPLHWAAFNKFDSVLSDIQVSLAKQIAEKGYQSVDGVMVPPTPLCVAAEEGHTSTVMELMTILPPPSCAQVNREGRNILHIAASKSDKETVQCILNNCPKEYSPKILNDKDVNGDTPLHLLFGNGCFIPELIKHKGVDLMARNNKDWTPLDMLYFEDTIKGDQLQIKKAVDDKQASQPWKFWRRSSIKGRPDTLERNIEANQHRTFRTSSVKVKLNRWQSDIQANQHLKSWKKRAQEKSNTQESIVPPRQRSKKDAEFNKAKKKLMKEELEFYRQRTNTQIIVTALITTVTFTVGFTLPGGYQQNGEDNEGLALLSNKAAFIVFMVADALALVLSTSSLFLYFISTMYQDPHKVSKLNAASTGLNIVSIIAMMLTFLAGTYAVLSHSPVLAITVCVIICLFFLLVIVLSIKMIYDRKDRKKEKIEV